MAPGRSVRRLPHHIDNVFSSAHGFTFSVNQIGLHTHCVSDSGQSRMAGTGDVCTLQAALVTAAFCSLEADLSIMFPASFIRIDLVAVASHPLQCVALDGALLG